ncbi:hypothetical protein [Bifidobacterium adolescentis]|uniref:hypothetical protein n=2 Tax=Bifidobacterium adolescentis TaxID=1680 RepID=UPI0022E5ABC0|nr:hypothetical protein [Bifidobacterium adolescentis]
MESNDERPVCPVCGEPVDERYRQKQGDKEAGDYHEFHRKCRNGYSRLLKERKAWRDEKERDEQLKDAWVERYDALELIARAACEYNESVPGHDRMVVRMVYELSRTAILMFQINPMIPLEYGDDFRRIATEIGSNGMDLIADSVHWNGVRRWNDDPDVSPEGRAPRTFMGRIREPGEELEDEYTGDLDHKETTVDVETALKHIWREDNIAGGRRINDRGPWTYK